MSPTISVCDLNPAVVEACQSAGLAAFHRSILDDAWDAVVSPGNSFGFMDGGVDWHYSQRFGPGLQRTLQERIAETDIGELLVGQCAMLKTGDDRIGGVLCAPTMRVPRHIADPMDIALACRAAVLAARAFDMRNIAFPGMGTGCGAVPPSTAARAMATGIHMALQPLPRPASWQEAQERHFRLEG